jgi:hypothetical protein
MLASDRIAVLTAGRSRNTLDERQYRATLQEEESF